MFNPEEERASCGVGFVVNAKGKRSNRVLQEAKTMLERMDHRGACACDENTGDGAGVMTSIPYELYSRFAREANVTLPPVGEFATGMIFVRVDRAIPTEVMQKFQKYAEECGLKILFWRMADVKPDVIGHVAKSREPAIVQVFVVPISVSSENPVSKLRSQAFVLRKYASHQMEQTCYICGLSPDLVVYKGMFTTKQLWSYYADLQDPDYATHFAMVHNRFSTNTLPTWGRAHPQRMIAHNGEINTLSGNVNYSRARESLMESRLFPTELLRDKLLPIIEAEMSDSGSLDNMLEFLYHCGNYSLPEVVIMLIPEAWHNLDPTKGDMPQAKWDFFRWAACSFEPWDGPALVVFCDGRYIGAVLDRNGLRPARFCATSDDMVYLASEVGVVDVPDDVRIVQKGRLKAGRLVIVDTQVGALLDDEMLKHKIATTHPYGEWLTRGSITLDKLHRLAGDLKDHVITTNNNTIPELVSVLKDPRMPMFGYNAENISMLLLPMLKSSKEALGSMGNDTPLACLSEENPLVFDYFQQLFAQVTNPPIDPFRERVVMTLTCPIGPQKNILIPSPLQTHRLWISHPIMTLADCNLLRSLDGTLADRCTQTSEVLTWCSHVIDATFSASQAREDSCSIGSQLGTALQKLCRSAEQAIVDQRAHLLVISDRAAGPDRIPIPILLALGAVHQHLLRKKLRMQVGLIVETGEAKEVHHFCTLVGFGADAICPYLVFESIASLVSDGLLPSLEDTISEVERNYVTAVQTGFYKVMAKMGISTLHSYKGAQIFEAVGLAESVMDMCFRGAASRIGGADFEVLARETIARHMLAYPESTTLSAEVNDFSHNPGFYHWRSGGEHHINNPETVSKLQAASRTNSRKAYEAYVKLADQSARHCTLRGLFDFNYAENPIPLNEVEPAADIVRRFATGAMSLGSISAETHEALAVAMNRIKARSNTGEGGERPERYLNPILCSSIKQVASARFGVTSSYLAHADMLQIKMAQGAKPGEGGELPGYKVTEEIAETRYAVPGVGLISPPPHHDIYSIEDLSQLIYDLKAANPLALVSVKLVSEVGVGVIAAGVAKARAAHITISGHDGGTGASSWTGIKHAGLPWELGIAETHQILVHQRTRSRVLLQVDGQIRTGRDVIVGALLGADEFAMSTAPLIVLGCIMMRKCHLNTCPVGIATQDPVLRAKFAGQPEHVINYLFLMAEEVREYMSRLGVRRLDDIIGHTEYLKPIRTNFTSKALKLDLRPLLVKSEPIRVFPTWSSILQEDWDPKNDEELTPVEQLAQYLHEDRALDCALLKLAQPILETPVDEQIDPAHANVFYEAKIGNSDRAFGSTLSFAISRQFNVNGLPEGRHIKILLRGSAGQSFCAFLAKGVTVRLEGDANDYVAKGLSGGHVTIVPPRKLLEQGFQTQQNLIVGNVCLYGATEGVLFLRGQAAERFCVRNSGAIVVVEGVGDHGCEYMTGGRAVILGRTGRNFAAGMSGGLAFVYDTDGIQGPFGRKCNRELVDLEPMTLENPYSSWLQSIIGEFTKETCSEVGAQILNTWESSIENFVLVFPRDYRRALAEMEEKQKETNQLTAQSINKNLPNKSTLDIEDCADNKSSYGPAQEPEEQLDKLRGFVRYARNKTAYRPTEERIHDWGEVYDHQAVRKNLRKQAARCMDCGVPFCQSYAGCPLGNLIPNWNDLVFNNDWHSAHLALLQTNNFPEFTGRVCPAPCEAACVLGINSDPVTIKNIECAIADKAWEQDWIKAGTEKFREPTGRRVVIVGSGPAGLACADQLNKAGHEVTVVERRDKPGGLLRYGIPTMKLDRHVLDRRLDLMRENGVQFVVSTRVGGLGDSNGRHDLNANCADNEDTVEWSSEHLLQNYDAVILCLGSTWPRDLNIPGRHLNGIYFALSFLERWQKEQHRGVKSPIDSRFSELPDEIALHALAKDKRVAILGGGDTGVDCIATSLRQGAKSVQTMEVLPPPPPRRDEEENPWPEWPRVWRTEYGHSEVVLRYGRDPRQFSTVTKEFLDNGSGSVCGLRTVQVEWSKNVDTGRWQMTELSDTENVVECDLVLLAMGFVGPETSLITQLRLAMEQSESRIKTQEPSSYATSVPRVFAAGDCRRGQSLVVHAINEGRQAAREVDLYLMGSTALPGQGGHVKAKDGRLC